MKRILLLMVVVGLFAGQAFAGLWYVDRPTALGFTTQGMVAGTSGVDDLSVYDGPTIKIHGPGPAAYGPMSGQVGFEAGMTGDIGNPIYGGKAIMQISYGGSPGLTGTGYDGISMYVQNDNNSRWSYQLFYTIGGTVDPSTGFVTGGTEYNSGAAYVELPPLGHSTVLTALASAPGALDLSLISNIGFRIEGLNMGAGNPAYPSYSDDFHTSVVPIPAALLLGLLGLGAAGVKLRRFA